MVSGELWALVREIHARGDSIQLYWSISPEIRQWEESRIEKVRKLIKSTTGESYDIERLKMLPLDPKFGRFILTDGDIDYGILWAMKMNGECARVLAFSIHTNLQGKGLGHMGWKKFADEAIRMGIKEVQLEVRQDNDSAIRLYKRRGLKIRGQITGFYRGTKGWLMFGPLNSEPSPQ